MTGVTIGCFLLAYLILWAVELTRLWFQIAWRTPLLIVLTILTLVTHALFLYDRQTLARDAVGHFTVPATFFDWSQIASFGLGFAYLILIIRRPQSVFGILILPIVVAIIAGSLLVQGGATVARGGDTPAAWAYIHGGGLSLAIVSVSLGFVVAILRLWQERRLKQKRAMSGPFKLPSLEYLDGFSRSCLIASTVFIATGLVGGAIMNSLQSEKLSWREPGILISGLLLLWLITAIFIEARAARVGASNAVRLNLITFAATVIAVAVVFANAHGRANQQQPKSTEAAVRMIRSKSMGAS